MARPVKEKRRVNIDEYTCGRCEQLFNSRPTLNEHMQNHPDSEPTTFDCGVCNWQFPDSLALEQHGLISGHPQNESPGLRPKCDRRSLTFSEQRDYNRHREHGKPCCDALHSNDWKKTPRSEYVDANKPEVGYRDGPQLAYDSDTTDFSQDGFHCKHCKKSFISMHAYNNHFLSCRTYFEKLTPDSSPELLRTPEQDQNCPPTSPTAQRHTVTLRVPAPRISTLTDATNPTTQSVTLNIRAPVTQAPAPLQTSTAPSIGVSAFVCNINGCTRSFRSEAGLRTHKIDAHGVGGQGLDLLGRDSWMLGQRERERLRAEGLLTVPAIPSSGRGCGRSGRRVPDIQRATPPFTALQRVPPGKGPYRQLSGHVSAASPPQLPASQNIGGALEMGQAKAICGKTLRLLLQTNMFIHHGGTVSVGGIDWTRIAVVKQPDVNGMFNDMCHLPRALQPLEYVPAPKAFAADYTAQYPVAEFENAPDRNPAKPGLDIIAVSCSKITLSNGRHEVVKIGAVDLLTCRVLMGHLVCSDPNADVANWNSSTTGLSDYKDMEDARQAGYKVFKGWPAARSALFKFIDKETIIVGHNLRSELDALRIIHGRAVDIAKVVEKAAQGPLSRAQVSLDSWCRDVVNVAKLRTDPVFGRDCIMDAFAAREIGLWIIKNRGNFEKVAKQKTREYQAVL